MGRQINFYMLTEDEQEFMDVVTAQIGAHVLLERSDSSSPTQVQTLPPQGTRTARQGVVLWCPSVCAPPMMKELGHRSYIVDKTNSEVIEFSRSEVIDDRLQRGRLWYAEEWWDAEFRAHPKRSEFLTWAKAVLGVVRKQCRNQRDGLYIGRHAEEWTARGGRTG